MIYVNQLIPNLYESNPSPTTISEFLTAIKAYVDPKNYPTFIKAQQKYAALINQSQVIQTASTSIAVRIRDIVCDPNNKLDRTRISRELLPISQLMSRATISLKYEEASDEKIPVDLTTNPYIISKSLELILHTITGPLEQIHHLRVLFQAWPNDTINNTSERHNMLTYLLLKQPRLGFSIIKNDLFALNYNYIYPMSLLNHLYESKTREPEIIFGIKEALAALGLKNNENNLFKKHIISRAIDERDLNLLAYYYTHYTHTESELHANFLSDIKIPCSLNLNQTLTWFYCKDRLNDIITTNLSPTFFPTLNENLFQQTGIPLTLDETNNLMNQVRHHYIFTQIEIISAQQMQLIKQQHKAPSLAKHDFLVEARGWLQYVKDNMLKNLFLRKMAELPIAQYRKILPNSENTECAKFLNAASLGDDRISYKDIPSTFFRPAESTPPHIISAVSPR